MYPIIFVGPMGAGKSTLAKKLAKQLGRDFVDTDRLIEAEHGPITEIFDSKGESHFRDLETAAFKTAIDTAGVVATGGGVVLSSNNRELMKKGVVVFLDTTQDAVVGRVNLEKRPLLKNNPDRWQEIYDQRLALYREVADIEVFTGTRPIKDLLAEISEKIEHHEL
jgi:shikimate kinase